MWQNYLIVGSRALLRNRAFAVINILGLAIGMAACILLLLYVRYETSYDEWLPGHERVFQIQTDYNDPANDRNYIQQSSPYVVGRSMAKDFPEIERVAYMQQMGPVILQNGVATTQMVVAADPAFLDIVQLPLVRGDRRTAMATMNSMLLSESEAAKRFPGVEAMGKTLSLVRNGKTIDYRITGILKDLPKNSHLSVDILVPFNPGDYSDEPKMLTAYGWNNGYNYVRLRPGASPADIAPRMAAWKKRNIPMSDVGGVLVSDGDNTEWHLMPIAAIHLSEAIHGPSTTNNDPRTIATFALIAVLILGMACVNFTNLSTARAGQRAREVALRKVMGASRAQLIGQFLGESLLIAAVSMLVALAIVELTLPLLAHFLDADLRIAYVGAGGVLLPVLLLTVLVGLAAGIYPAFVLSGFDPAPVLKSNRSGTDTQGSGRLRSALVIAQFAVSIALIICTAVVAAQTTYARSVSPGFNREGLLQVTGIGRRQVEPIAESIVTAIAHVPGVEAVGRTRIGVNTDSQISTSVRVDGNPKPIQLGNYNVDDGFFRAMGLDFIAGRGFRKDNPRDDATIKTGDTLAEAALAARGVNIVINAAAAQKLGFRTPTDALNQTIRADIVDSKYGLVPATIVGIVRDARFRSVRDPYEAIMYTNDPANVTEMVVRVRVRDAAAVRDRIQTVWNRYAPQVPFQAQFTDDIVRQQYDADEARAKIFAAFAGLAIFVACLGLYGLAAFTAERRTREIGIRKVLGARNGDIVRLLVWQFSKPVLLANLIAWPIAWWVMRGWLDGFAARIALGPQWFLLAGGLAILVAAATIIGHALKVARRSPALALRYE